MAVVPAVTVQAGTVIVALPGHPFIAQPSEPRTAKGPVRAAVKVTPAPPAPRVSATSNARARSGDAASSDEDQRWVLPVASYTLSASFGEQGRYWSSGYHTGQDFAAPAGTPVRAVHQGTVAFAGWAGPYGNAVKIVHAGGTQTWYAHLGEITVARGRVRTGQTIGSVGCTGNCFGDHVHLEVRLGADLPINPLRWLKFVSADGLGNVPLLGPVTLPSAQPVPSTTADP